MTREEYKAYKREWSRRDRAADPAKYRAYRLKSYHRAVATGRCYQCGGDRHPDLKLCVPCRRKNSNQNRKRRTGATPEWWAKTLAEQNNACRVCGTTARLAADHDHGTKELRGILCGRCNTTLGMVKDDPETLVALANYLRHWRAR